MTLPAAIVSLNCGASCCTWSCWRREGGVGLVEGVVHEVRARCGARGPATARRRPRCRSVPAGRPGWAYRPPTTTGSSWPAAFSSYCWPATFIVRPMAGQRGLGGVLGLLADVGQRVQHRSVGHHEGEGAALLQLAVLGALVEDDVVGLGVAAQALDVGLPVELGDAVQGLGALQPDEVRDVMALRCGCVGTRGCRRRPRAATTSTVRTMMNPPTLRAGRSRSPS